MPYEIVMPRLGWNMEEGTLVEWLKQDGEKISQGEMVCTIEGDKAATDVESFESGILKIPDASPQPGLAVPVGTLLGYVVAEAELETFDPNQVPVDDGSGERVEAGSGECVDDRPGERVEAGPSQGIPSEPVAAGVGDRTEPGREPAVSERDRSRTTESNVPAVGTAGVATGSPREQDVPATGVLPDQDTPAISPRARRAAQSAGIDWRSLKGSGRSGRIVERDVLEASRRHESAMDGPAGKATATHGGQVDLRKVIARRMAEAHRTTAPVTLHTEADVTAISSYLQSTFRPSWYDLMLKIAAVALAEHPVMNASWRDGVALNDGIHIGIAVDTAAGVIAPVIRDVPGKSLKDISAASKLLIQAARDGKLTLDQIEGGTFTLTNLGMYNIDAFTPIIHSPQCAILGLGQAAPRVVVIDESDGTTGIRRIMSLSLTFDHRIVDGAPAARFLQRIRQLAEAPESVFGKSD